MAGDIFRQLNQLFRKEPIEGEVNIFSLHRFLSSELIYAPIVKQVSGKIRDDELTVELWKTMLPKARAAPFFKWPAPKKATLPDELVKKIAEVENWSYLQADEMSQMMIQVTTKDQVFAHYGIDATAT